MTPFNVAMSRNAISFPMPSRRFPITTFCYVHKPALEAAKAETIDSNDVIEAQEKRDKREVENSRLRDLRTEAQTAPQETMITSLRHQF